ncbi:MAG: IclR family transcriptional regulator [Alphaproteobacteria bacterium]
MATSRVGRREPTQQRSGTRPKEAGGIQVLERAIGIMEAVAAVDGITLTSLAHQTGTTTSTAHRILTTLEANGFVTMDRERKLWFIGVTAFQVGAGFLRNRKVVDLARPLMRDLMAETGESVNLGIEDNGAIVYLAQIECHNPIRAFHRPGTRTMIHSSAMGKAILASWSDQAIKKLMEKVGMPGFTRKTLTNDRRFFADLEKTRERQWAFDDEEATIGMRCVAAAVYNEFSEVVAAVSISGPTTRLTYDRIGELGPRIKRAAAEMTAAIGGEPPEA